LADQVSVSFQLPYVDYQVKALGRKMNDASLYAAERQRMVEEQLVSRDIRDQRVLEAMRTIPRHYFVSSEYCHLAYADGPLPIGKGQTISQPYIVALMTQMLGLQGDENVLEIGTGSGYQAAILAHLSREVHTVERHAQLADEAVRALKQLGLANVHVHVGDGSQGLPEFSPYQAILVTAAAPRTPQVMLDQLDDGGRLVIPVGGQSGQYLQRWQRHKSGFTQEVLVPVAFVPLRGQSGWREDIWENH
jgi:protein-L-isoaspartate(D-aspartate) O-methyltransferase